MCGKNTCHTYVSSGNWNETHTLKDKRYGHSSWITTLGIFLIGGSSSFLSGFGNEASKTTELIKKDQKDPSYGFQLEYRTA